MNKIPEIDLLMWPWRRGQRSNVMFNLDSTYTCSYLRSIQVVTLKLLLIEINAILWNFDHNDPCLTLKERSKVKSDVLFGFHIHMFLSKVNTSFYSKFTINRDKCNFMKFWPDDPCLTPKNIFRHQIFWANVIFP